MSISFENASSIYATVGGLHKKVNKIFKTVDGVWQLVYEGDKFASLLVDFEYIDNGDGTVTLTAWKGTLNGVASTELVIPDDSRIIL